MTAAGFDRAEAARFLELLFAGVPGLVSVGYIDPATGRTGWETGTDLDALAGWPAGHDHAPKGVYVRMTTLGRRPDKGRGLAEDAHALTCLWADLDYGTDGHKPPANGRPNPATEADALALIAGLPAPTVLIHSGGGLYPLWVLEDPFIIDGPDAFTRARELSEGWQAIIGRAADRAGVSYGTGVGDLARVLRLPGTNNWKTGTARPCMVLDASGPRYRLDVLSSIVAAAQPAEAPARVPAPVLPPDPFTRANTGTGPLDRLAEGADWLDVLPPGWQRVRPNAANVADAFRRPGATSYDSAHVLRDNPHVLVVHSESAGMPTGAGQRLTKGRVYAYTWHNGDASAAARGILDGTSPGLSSLPTACLPPAEGPLRAVTPSPTPDPFAPVYGPPDAPEQDEDAPARPASWAPQDLDAILDGTFTPLTPTLLPRSDGACLLYPGCTHSVHGESESGKSLVMQYETTRLITAGGHVLYVDFESDAAQVVGRLRMFGAPVEAIRARFHYVNPEASPFATETERDAWRAILARPYALAVIDGVTDSVGLFGYSSKDNDELSTWQRVFPDALARHTGAAVVSIDHVTKDGEGRGRFAIGAQAKMAGLTGAAYTCEVTEPLGLGLRGVVVLRVAKDRPGQVRPKCGKFRASDRTQPAARIVFDATGPEELVTVETGDDAQGAPAVGAAEWRPTAYMERVSVVLEDAPGPLSLRGVLDATSGKEKHVRHALDVLIAEGHVSVHPGPRNAQLHTLVTSYRQAEDPRSDAFEGGDGQTDFSPLSDCRPSPLYTGGDGATDTTVARATVGRQSGDGQTVDQKCACGKPLWSPASKLSGQCAACSKGGAA